jgi:hypothetical protein
MSCQFKLDDGAYILGALSPAERAEYERHLATCPACRESIAALAVLPGLLGRLDPMSAQPTLPAPPSLLPRVLAAARDRRLSYRRRRLVGWVAGGLAAAALAAIVGVGVQLYDRRGPSVVAPAPIAYSVMHPADGYTPVEAELGIQPGQTGTLVAVRCLYRSGNQTRWPIWLVVYARDDQNGEPIGSWVAIADTQISVTAVTHYMPAQIARIELQSSNHTMIAWWTPGAA